VLRFQPVAVAMQQAPFAQFVAKNMRHPVGPSGDAIDAGHALVFKGFDIATVETLS
jgi:hypothetical protein